MLVNPESTNVHAYITVIEEGSDTLTRLVHPRNALSPMLLILSGISTVVSPVQSEKALLSIFVICSGNSSEVNPVQPLNIPQGMLVQLLGMGIFVSAEQL